MKLHLTTAMALALMVTAAQAGIEEAKEFLDAEIDNSTLTREEQEAEMQWFIDAAKQFEGMDINVVSETITTHEYESKVLAPAFSAIIASVSRASARQGPAVLARAEISRESSAGSPLSIRCEIESRLARSRNRAGTPWSSAIFL